MSGHRRYNVALRAGMTRDEANDKARTTRAAATAREGSVDRGHGRSAETVELDDADVDQVAKAPGVEYVEPDKEAVALPSALDVSQREEPVTVQGEIAPWGIERTGATTLHKQGVTGADVVVAVLDTGGDSDHPDLEPNWGQGSGWYRCGETGDLHDGADCSRGWDDDGGHGTHCAGIIGGATTGSGVYGMAPDAELRAYKVLQADGTGKYSKIANGMVQAVKEGADVLSMSLGGQQARILKDAVDFAEDNGVPVVAAAGNSSCEDCIGAPAVYDWPIAVSATDRQGETAHFVSRGSEMTIAAPGVDVLSTIPGGEHARKQGTSMAAPHVAGALAQLLGAGHSLGDALGALYETAVGEKPATEQGNGRLRVDHAHEQLASDGGSEGPR
jgi:subtilisin